MSSITPSDGLYNDLLSTELSVVDQTNPDLIVAYRNTVADAINDATSAHRVVDLSDHIADIIIETSAQGASQLEVHITDPQLLMLASGFISVDADGFLYPPVQLVFPKDTKMTWTLVQLQASGDTTDANLVLVFEDSIVSSLRNVDASSGGVNGSSQGETLGHWIMRLVDAANKKQGTEIQLVEWISPQDPDYAAPTIPNNKASAPTHLQQKYSPAAQTQVGAAIAAGAQQAAKALKAAGGDSKDLYLGGAW